MMRGLGALFRKRIRLRESAPGGGGGCFPRVCMWRRLARTGRQTGGMDRTIVEFRQDDGGTWIADLECGHSQHIRHQPPFKLAPWVLEDEGRASRIGQPLECRLCDQEGSS